MTIIELEQLMKEYGICIRAISNKCITILEKQYIDDFPNGKVIFLPEYKREMLVVETIPKHAGKFLIESVHGTGEMVNFSRKFYDSIEDAVNAIKKVRSM